MDRLAISAMQIAQLQWAGVFAVVTGCAAWLTSAAVARLCHPARAAGTFASGRVRLRADAGTNKADYRYRVRGQH